MGRPFKGGHIRKLGGETEYRLIWFEGKQQLEHRIVMARVLGRPLLRSEIVHHKDENGLNNDPSNLEVMTQAEHRRLHGGPRCWRISYEEAVRMRVEEGATLGRIAATAGVTAPSIRSAFRRRGVPTQDRRWGNNCWNIELGIQRLAEGWTLSSIAREVGVAVSSVTKAFTKRGLWPPTRR